MRREASDRTPPMKSNSAKYVYHLLHPPISLVFELSSSRPSVDCSPYQQTIFTGTFDLKPVNQTEVKNMCLVGHSDVQDDWCFKSVKGNAAKLDFRFRSKISIA